MTNPEYSRKERRTIFLSLVTVSSINRLLTNYKIEWTDFEGYLATSLFTRTYRLNKYFAVHTYRYITFLTKVIFRQSDHWVSRNIATANLSDPASSVTSFKFSHFFCFVRSFEKDPKRTHFSCFTFCSTASLSAVAILPVLPPITRLVTLVVEKANSDKSSKRFR